jgi:hypothetical protein
MARSTSALPGPLRIRVRAKARIIVMVLSCVSSGVIIYRRKILVNTGSYRRVASAMKALIYRLFFSLDDGSTIGFQRTVLMCSIKSITLVSLLARERCLSTMPTVVEEEGEEEGISYRALLLF